MKHNTKHRWRPLWVLPPVALGILVLVFMVGSRQPPAQSQFGEPSRAVRVIEIPKLDLVPYAEGHGTVQPAQIWTAVAQVSGRIIEMHPQLRNGEIIPADTLLFRVDPVDYELSLAQAQAESAELSVQKENAKASLNIEMRNQAIAQRELNRLEKLAAKGSVSQSKVDEAERALLATRAVVQNLKNTLSLIPTQQRLLEARQAQAERDLANTSVSAPFNLRVANLAIETDQFVSKGQSLFEGDSVDQVEVIARIAMSSLRNLFIGRPDKIPDVNQFNSELAGFTGFKPTLALDMGTHTARWQGRFVRFTDNVDSATRTIGVVVAVDNPLSKTRPGERPPLSKGMFVQVRLLGHRQADRIILPRSAIRDGRVYLVNRESRLQVQAVDVLYSLDEFSVVQEGVEAGQVLVLTDLIPAVENMLLEPVADGEAQARLLQVAGAAP